MLDHLFHDACGERTALLAMISEWPLIGSWIRGLFGRLHRKPPPRPRLVITELPEGFYRLDGDGIGIMIVTSSPGDCLRTMDAIIGEDPYEACAIRLEELAQGGHGWDPSFRTALALGLAAIELRTLRAEKAKAEEDRLRALLPGGER